MTTLLASEPMADDKAKTLSVKLHMDVIESARIVAAIRNISMTDMLSDMLRPDLVRMERDELAKRTAATQQVKPRFGGSTETSEERATRLAPQLLDPKPDKPRPKR
jgi:hypothetical protein